MYLLEDYNGTTYLVTRYNCVSLLHGGILFILIQCSKTLTVFPGSVHALLQRHVHPTEFKISNGRYMDKWPNSLTSVHPFQKYLTNSYYFMDLVYKRLIK